MSQVFDKENFAPACRQAGILRLITQIKARIELNYMKNKMKIILIISVITLGITGILASYLFTPDRIFKNHVLSETSETIKGLKYYRDRCGMHGPFIFAFKASQQDIQIIIQKNKLIKYEKLPDFPTSLLAHIDSHNLPWWKSLDELKQMEVYAKEDSGGHEPHLKFIFIDIGNQVYYLQM